jgi:selenophosphate synthetase-related protein
MNHLKQEIKKALGHMCETNQIRKVFWHMDEKVEKLRYGIQQGDDSIIVGKLVVNMEGPYPMKIGRKTGLIHTCSDIVVMGAKPLFALNSMQVSSMEEAKEISLDIKKQSLGLNVPVVGGNTQTENLVSPCVSFTVVGKLINKEIPDSGVKEKDKILMLGEPVEGDIGERVFKAKTKFETFFELISKGIEIHASKDCSRGGWFGNLTELLVKSKRGIKITSIPYPRLTRYMGNYLVGIPENEVKEVIEIATKHKCPVVEIGIVTKEQEISIGNEVIVNKKKMRDLIRKFPFKKSKEK